MVFSNNVAFLLTLLLSTTSLLAFAEEVVYQAHTRFALRSDVHLTLEEQLFSADSLRNSFDHVYKNDKAEMKNAALQNLMRLPTTLHPNNTRSDTTNVFQWVVDWNVQSICSSCHVMQDMLWVEARNSLSTEQRHKTWETGFCETLRSGSFEIFRDVDDCHIALHVIAATTETPLADQSLSDSAATVVTDHQQIIFNARASFGLPTDEEMTKEEQIFTSECLRFAYDQIHEEDDIIMEKAKLQHQFNVPHKAGSHNNGALVKATWNPKRWMDFTYVWGWEVSAYCRMCFGNLLLEAQDSQENLMKRRKREQDRWETAFCKKLRAGPFDKFKAIRSCNIVIYKED